MPFTDEQIKWFEKNKGISNTEVERDIADTEAEILVYDRLANAEAERAALMGPDARMADMRSRAYRDNNADRRRFIEKLKLMLEYRREQR